MKTKTLTVFYTIGSVLVEVPFTEDELEMLVAAKQGRQ